MQRTAAAALVILGLTGCTTTDSVGAQSDGGWGSPSTGGSRGSSDAGRPPGALPDASPDATLNVALDASPDAAPDANSPDATPECAHHWFDAVAVSSLPIEGAWRNEAGTLHTVTLAGGPMDEVGRGSWIVGEGPNAQVHFILEDGGSFLTMVNSATHNVLPCLYSRFDWIVDAVVPADAGGFADSGLDAGTSHTYLCETIHNAASALEAWETRTADRDDLKTGCNGEPWQRLQPTTP